GLTDWIRGVADQAAAAGYIAIAPDLLSGHGPEGGNSSSMDRQGVVAAIRGVLRADVNRRLQAAAEYAMALPSAAPRVASVGFCWGGSSSFEFAVAYGDLAGAVVYYGGAPAAESLTSVQAPVLGLYGGNDERVNASIPGAREAMDRLGKTYEPIVYEGAGHGFLRQLDGQEGANLRAAQQAWPRTLEFFREVLGG
ncbi:MAG TPA: dienelactone hydrolase family protein, partial [Longimicrobiales bacterium]